MGTVSEGAGEHGTAEIFGRRAPNFQFIGFKDGEPRKAFFRCKTCGTILEGVIRTEHSSRGDTHTP